MAGYITNGGGYGFAAGFFLANDEDCTRLSTTVSAEHAQAVERDNGRKVVPAGAVIPANGGTAKGILYEDIDVTNGDEPGSIVTEGVIYEDRLPDALASAAKTALKGIQVIAKAPEVTRPYDKEIED